MTAEERDWNRKRAAWQGEIEGKAGFLFCAHTISGVSTAAYYWMTEEMLDQIRDEVKAEGQEIERWVRLNSVIRCGGLEA